MKMQYRKVDRYLSILKEQIWRRTCKIDALTVCPTDYKSGHTPPPLSDFRPIEYGGRWGSGIDTHAWFHFTVDGIGENTYLGISTERSGWDANNPQFMVYVNGELKQGLDTNHREVYIGDAGESADVYLYAYVGMVCDSAEILADVRELNTEVYGLYYDLLYPFEMLAYLDPESAEYAQILYYLYRAVSLLSLYEVGSREFGESVLVAREYMRDEFYRGYCRPQTAKAVCIGHTHIDCAWRWTLEQTREKVQRSFATVLELMRRYPEYKFMSSQAFLYQNLKEEAPALYAEVAERIRQGRWECEGAMWVEADCNLSSGESLVRQILYGKNFFRREFGVDNRVLWLPDVFGYSAALPQILRKSDVDWFVTSKISWNDTNRMPSDTFLWRGIDGSEINTHFLTAQNATRGATENHTTYNATTHAPMIAGSYKRYSEKHLSDESLVTFGFGDGGGGPTAEQLELARRGACGIPGSPEVKIEFAGEYLRRLEARLAEGRDVPSWQGELYLEFHRGTYTTMAKNKRNNRKSEFLYENAEMLATSARVLFGDAFPREALHRGWEDILTNQFHDIIPGSSIKAVYDRSDRDYAEIRRIGEEITEGVMEKIADSLDARGGTVIFNPNSFTGEGLVKVDGVSARVKGIPAKGYLLTKELSFDCGVRVDGRTVESDALRVCFNDAWQIVSLYDKLRHREVLSEGRVGNELRVYADYPDRYDAWEWQEYSTNEYKVIDDVSEVSVVEDGARRGIRTVRRFMHSSVTQTVWFTDGTTAIDFDTVVDWHDRHLMLKAVFPVDVNTDKASYDIQFGTVERPTHFNTSWDRARFEVCGHKFADLSEGGYGVSLLNDCKYGYGIHGGEMSLSLLRSPTEPNPEADQGESFMVYSLYPHAGTLAESDTVLRAYGLNQPLTARRATGAASSIPTAFSLLSLDCDNVICETVKEAEAEDGTVIRLYESKNIRSTVRMRLGFPAKRAYLTDLMEKELAELPISDGVITLPIRGFEILTVKIQ